MPQDTQEEVVLPSKHKKYMEGQRKGGTINSVKLFHRAQIIVGDIVMKAITNVLVIFFQVKWPYSLQLVS